VIGGSKKAPAKKMAAKKTLVFNSDDDSEEDVKVKPMAMPTSKPIPKGKNNNLFGDSDDDDNDKSKVMARPSMANRTISMNKPMPRRPTVAFADGSDDSDDMDFKKKAPAPILPKAGIPMPVPAKVTPPV
jgi:hypothetical protein